MASSIVLVAIIAVLAGIGIGVSGVFNSEGADTIRPNLVPDMSVSNPPLHNVTIGHIVPLTGDVSKYGIDSKVAVNLAVDDYNAYLETLGVDWRIKVAHEDSRSDPTIALEKLVSLQTRGIDIVIGPYSSSNLHALVDYVESNNMILISPSSSASQLAIPDDSVFRLAQDDNKQSLALARLIFDSEIDTIVTLQREDTWGNGLYASTRDAFEKLGGTAVDSIRYSPDVDEFATSVSLLADNVSTHVGQKGASNVAVLSIGFAETLEVLQDASTHDILDDVLWFCTDGFSTNNDIFDDALALEFARATDMHCMQTAVSDNSVRDELEPRIVDVLGYAPNTYAYSAYDGLWIAGNTVLETGTVNTSVIRDVLPFVAAHHNGAIGSTMLNDAGDLDAALYSIWSIDNDQWVDDANYIGALDKIIPTR